MDANERRARVTEEATYWWTHLGTKAPADVSETDREEFTRWLRESPVHVAELLRVAHVHDALERFELWNEIPLSAPVKGDNVSVLPAPFRTARADPEAEPDRKRRRVAQFGVAAGICLVAIAAGWFTLHLRASTIETERAERREVVLADGSVVNLEPETLLRVDLEPRLRSIALERGRALFHVAKDPNRPFIVHTNATDIRAVGTVFGVEQKDQNIIVTVSEGKVGVTPTAQSAAAANANPQQSATPAERVFLTANQQVMVRKSGRATAVRDVDSGRALAWSQGRLVFESTSLAEVADEFNRYNRMQLHINGAELARRTISGVFRASDPDTLIAFVSAGARVEVSRRGDEEIVISPAP